MTLDELRTALANLDAPGATPVRLMIDFARHGQWEADLTGVAACKSYKLGRFEGVPYVVLIHED